MEIDERKEVIDILDHNLLQGRLMMETKKNEKGNSREETEYNKKNKESLVYVKKAEECENDRKKHMEKLERIMKMVAEKKDE